MFKFGIYNRQQLINGHSFRWLYFGRKKVSATIYDQVHELADGDVIGEKILEDFTDEHGRFKRTYSNRFEPFDQAVVEIIKGKFMNDAPIIVHDMGVADARTSCDLFEKLCFLFPQIQYYSSDNEPSVNIVETGRTKLILNNNQQVLEIVWPPFVFNMKNPDNIFRYPLNRLIQWGVNKFIVPNILRTLANHEISSRPMSLFSSRALDLTRQDKRFHLCAYDMVMRDFGFPHPNIIRVMNVLNPGYFKKDELATIFSQLFEVLLDQGLLIIGSNTDSGSIVDGNVFQKDKNGFRMIFQSGAGAPVGPQKFNGVHGMDAKP